MLPLPRPRKAVKNGVFLALRLSGFEGLDGRQAYVDLHQVPGRVERVDQQHVKYFLDLPPGKKQVVSYSVTYKRRKVGPELNTEKKREPL